MGGAADDRHLKGPVARRERRAMLEPGWSDDFFITHISEIWLLFRVNARWRQSAAAATQCIKRRIERNEDISVCHRSFRHLQQVLF